MSLYQFRELSSAEYVAPDVGDIVRVVYHSADWENLLNCGKTSSNWGTYGWVTWSVDEVVIDGMTFKMATMKYTKM